MSHFEATVEIARRREDVFAYVANPAHLADWNSAVERLTPRAGVSPARHLMERRLPGGPVTNELSLEQRRQARRDANLRTLRGLLEHRGALRPAAS